MVLSLVYASSTDIDQKELDDWSYRYLITAPTMEVVDEWWRVVSAKYKAPKRIQPDFYLHSSGEFNLSTSIQAGQVASDFLNKMIFTLLEDRDGRIQSTFFNYYPLSDHISGNK